MRETSRRQEIRVGLVTLGAIAALIGGIVWGKGFGFSVSNRVLRFHFPNAAGVDVGTPVTLHGVRQGSVTKLTTDATGVLVDALVETDVPLHADTRARIEMAELTGGKRIELDPGTATADLRDGAVIDGKVAGDPAMLLSEAGAIATNASLLVLRLDTAVSAVNTMLRDGSIQRRVDNTLINLEDASGAARGHVGDNRARNNETIGAFKYVVRDLHAMINKTGPAVDRTLVSAEVAAGDARVAMGVAQNTLRQADTLVRRLDSVVWAVKNGHGTTAMLLNDTAFANDLRRTVESTRAFIEHSRKNGININFSLGRR
jgi:phospholipid/cholesterol/gamma-HCH transport system substrate-binding protein